MSHLDPLVLEREFLLAVDQAHPRDVPGRTLILVPTARLVDHVQRRLAERRSAWLGLEVLTPSGLARRILAEADQEPEVTLSARILDALLQQVLLKHPDNAWVRFVAERPGALPRLRAALNDLREAGLSPADLTKVAGRRGRKGATSETPADRALTPLYADYVAALEQAQASGRTDETGLTQAALPHAKTLGAAYAHVFVHGAYEWIGVHLDLLKELGRETQQTLFLPAHRERRVAAYSNAYAERFLTSRGTQPRPLPDPLPIEQRFELAALFDEEASPRPAATQRIGFRHCQGEAAEVKIAVREALAAIRDGCAPSEIAITARSLEPYAAALEQAFEDEDLPWTSSLKSPLRRHPLVRDFLLMLEIVADDFPRRATAEWLRSSRILWTSFIDDGPPAGVDADIWSRKARIINGLHEWTDELPKSAGEVWFHPTDDDQAREDALRAAGRRRESANKIGRALAALRRKLRPERRTWTEHVGVLKSLLDTVFEQPEREDAAGKPSAAGAALDALHALLDELPLLESVVGDSRKVPFQEVREWVQTAVDQHEIPLYRRDDGGIRVLDAMQLRGLTCKRLFFLGLNSGLFPRPAREDPILSDDLRRQLRDTAKRPLPIKAAGNEEERLLLAGILGAAEDRVEISWQRADESGKARTPSLALREIARVTYGKPDMDDIRHHARHLRSHPTQWLEDLTQKPGLLAPSDERLLRSLRAVGPGAGEELARRFPEIASGLRMLHATQSFRTVDPQFDGRVGPRRRPELLSVSAFETLGRCPLQFFFNRTLGIRELDDQADALEIESRELGTRIHEVLDRTYQTLQQEGLLEIAKLDAALTRADALVEDERPNLLGASGPRLARRVPILFRHLNESWARAVRAFVHADLSMWIGLGYESGAFETEVSETLDFGDGVSATVRGRLDRTLYRDGVTLVGDYKTAGNLKRRVDIAKMLRAETLQVPLYRLLAGEGAKVELLGVGPDFCPDPDEAGAGEASYRHPFEGFKDDNQTSGFRETARTLLTLRQDGSFPFNKGQHCEWCAFAQACRRNHPPSTDREDHAEDSRAYRGIHKKNAKNPLLDELSGAS